VTTKKKDAAEPRPSDAPHLPDLSTSVTRDEPSLNPALVEIRNAESAQLAEVVLHDRADAALDPDLAKLRDAEAKAAAERLS
jgi:hypothetical protein